MTALIALALVLEPKPIVVPAVRNSYSWIVPASIEGKKTTAGLILSSNVGMSAVDANWLTGVGLETTDGAARTLRVGTWDAGRFQLQVGRLEPLPSGKTTDGVLGLDVLSKAAIGFDLTTGSVAIWPGGKVPRSEATRWVVSSAPWPADPNKPDSWEGDVGTDAQGFPTISGTVAGRPTTFRLLLSGPEVVLPAKAPKGLDPLRVVATHDDGAECLAMGIQVGPKCPWTMVRIGAPPADGLEPDEPTVSLEAIPSRRIILDLPAHKIYAQRLTGSAQAALAFAKFLPVHLDGRTLRIGPAAESSTEAGPRTSKHDGDEVLSFCGIDAKSLVDMIVAGDGCTRTQLESLADAIAKGGVLRLMHEGKIVEIRGGGVKP